MQTKHQQLVDEIRVIIAGCIKGDKDCQRKLFNMFGPKMLSICRRYCTGHDDACDAMQEGFIKVFTQIERFKGDSKFETWMTRIFINTAIDHFKKSTKFTLIDDHSRFDSEDFAGFESDTEPDFNAEKAQAALDQLPTGYRMIFNLYVMEGFGHKEIARQLGISEGTSKSQYARAKKLLIRIITGKETETGE